MPIRREKRTQSIMEQSLPILQLLPNARTPTLQPLNLGATFERKEESCNPSELYDPVNTGKQAISPFEHNDIIRVVQNVITVISESNRSVSGPWLFEIIRVLGRLEEQRRVLKHASISRLSPHIQQALEEGAEMLRQASSTPIHYLRASKPPPTPFYSTQILYCC